MKKIVVVLCALLLSSAVFAGGNKDSGVDTSFEDVKSRGIFVLGLDDAFPPMGFRDESNTITGYDIDLAREVCTRLGLELKCQPIDWSAKQQELDTGNIDCIWNGLTITEQREKVLCFTDPYLNNAQVAIVRIEDGFKTLADLKGKKIGLQAGSSASDALESNEGFKKSVADVIEFKENLTALMDLEIGGIDAVIMDMVVGNYSIKTTGKPFVMIKEPLANEAYGIAFRKNDEKLCSEVQKTLNAMALDGTVEKISEKWFGTDISVIGK